MQGIFHKQLASKSGYFYIKMHIEQILQFIGNRQMSFAKSYLQVVEYCSISFKVVFETGQAITDYYIISNQQDRKMQ